MKKKYIVISFLLFALILVGLVFSLGLQWRFLERFAEPCGYSSFHKTVECECDGYSFEKINVGPSTWYCLGECKECACSEDDIETDCEDFSELDWAFPLAD
jgi:hypothetical protein